MQKIIVRILDIKETRKELDRPYEIKEGFVYLVDYKIKDISSFM